MMAQYKLWLIYLGGDAINKGAVSAACPPPSGDPPTHPPALSMNACRSDMGTLPMFLITLSRELRASLDSLPCRREGPQEGGVTLQDSYNTRGLCMTHWL